MLISAVERTCRVESRNVTSFHSSPDCDYFIISRADNVRWKCRPNNFQIAVEMLGSHAHVASALLLLTMAIALNEAREDYVMLGIYAVGLLHGALLFALSRGGESRRMCTPRPKAAATPTPAPPAKSPVSVRPAAQLTMTVDKFESLRAGRKEPTAVLTPTSSRRKSLRTPNKVPRLGEWSE